MDHVVYDESFEGFLTAIFHIYEYGLANVSIIRGSKFQKNIFGTNILS